MLVTVSNPTKIQIYVNANRKSMSQIKQELGCQYIMNAGLYNMAKFTSVNMLTVDGQVLSTGGTPHGYAINGTKVVFSYANNVKYPNFLGAYPVLVRDGKPTGANAPAGLEGYRPRSAMGLTKDGKIVLLCDQSNRSLNGIADGLVNAGCETAINLDGGGSCQCDFNGTYMRSSRIVHNYICIWTDSKKKEDDGTKTICIDAGHGTTCENGSPDGLYKEHEFALDIANRIKSILERHDVKVIMTRSDGTDISLAKRCKLSNNANADYFVSIHTNAYGDSWNDANGWEIYCVAKGGNAEKLAKSIEWESRELGLKDRGVKTANYYVLKYTDCPAVLIEHGFHTNKSDCEKLKSDAFRQKCAEADAKGILSILGISYKAAEATQTAQDNWYDSACAWVKENGIADGTRPTEHATRAEVFQMLMNLKEK